jgi:simple sugar transport system permease protein
MFGTELSVLAVAILGGASLVDGVGSMGGVILGVLLLAMMQNGLNLLGVSSYFFGVVIGLAILISISITSYTEQCCAVGRRWPDGRRGSIARAVRAQPQPQN